ncbi:MAG: hypothetical protein KGM17_10310 [Sphingomonadales bacterium]|nr:hypothetical protein [Sphingomonadales bacterium]
MNLIGKSLMATIATATLALGIAAPASAQGWSPDRSYDRGYARDGWQGGDRFGGNPRFAINQCSRAAAHQAYGNARVTQIRDVDRTRDGFRIRGDLVVDRQWSGYGRGWANDRGRGDRGSFTCRVDHGRVVDLDLHGLRD